MAKSKVSFSIALLKSNLSHHKKQIKTLTKSKNMWEKLGNNKQILKNIQARLAPHQRYFDDITLAITKLKKVK